jgi:hypothetical protein
MSGGCNNTGVQTVSGDNTQNKQLITGRVRIQSLKVCNDGTVDKTVTFYDGTANTATKIAEVHVGAVNQNIDFDMHGSIAVNGVFVEISGSGSNSGVSFSVQYF